MRIELADRSLAEDLRRQLRPFDIETVAVDGHMEVWVELTERNPDSQMVGVLNAIDTWLLTAGVPSVRVHLDRSTYTLHAPPFPSENGNGALAQESVVSVWDSSQRSPSSRP